MVTWRLNFFTKINKLFLVACFSFQLKGDAEVQGYRKNIEATNKYQ